MNIFVVRSTTKILSHFSSCVTGTQNILKRNSKAVTWHSKLFKTNPRQAKSFVSTRVNWHFEIPWSLSVLHCQNLFTRGHRSYHVRSTSWYRIWSWCSVPNSQQLSTSDGAISRKSYCLGGGNLLHRFYSGYYIPCLSSSKPRRSRCTCLKRTLILQCVVTRSRGQAKA